MVKMQSNVLPSSSSTASPSYRRHPLTVKQATRIPDASLQVLFSESIMTAPPKVFIPSPNSSCTSALTLTTGRDLG